MTRESESRAWQALYSDDPRTRALGGIALGMKAAAYGAIFGTLLIGFVLAVAVIVEAL